MSVCSIGYAVIVAIAFVGGACAAEPAFQMVEAEAGSDVQVIGATPAAAGEWPATFRFTRNGKFCTSTIVGSRAILTAAHCVGDGQTGTIKISGRSIAVKCSRHPRYASNIHFDVAMCSAAAPISLANGAKYESLNGDPVAPKKGTWITLLGFGCRSADDRTSSGALYQGQAELRNAEFVFLKAVGGAAVCFGDSGGAAYYLDAGTRRIAAVNSDGDINKVSHLTNVANNRVSNFFKSWSQSNGIAVCGVTGGTNCN